MDSLLLLRSALSSSSSSTKTIKLLSIAPTETTEVYTLLPSTHISLPTPSGVPTLFPKTTPTRYQTPANDGGTFYDLQTLLFAYLERDASVAEYLKAASEQGVPFVSLTERKGLIDWLEGKSGIEGPQGKIVPLAMAGAGAGEGMQGDGVGKKRSVGEEVNQGMGEDAGGMNSLGAGEKAIGQGTGLQGRSSAVLPAGVDSAVKKARYVVDDDDRDVVKKMIILMDGPPRAKGGSMGGATKNKDTILRGERVNVRSCFSSFSPSSALLPISNLVN